MAIRFTIIFFIAMGGLLAFRVGNFDTTAERQQFRFLCEQLKAHYEDSSDKYDLILSCKVICEMLVKKRIENKAYKLTASMLSSKLTDKGIMLIEDVTIKSPATEKFIPYMLNAELNEFVAENDDFATIYPTACKDKESKCINGCFFKKEIRVTHSAKNNDISKIIYRIIGKKPFAENVVVSSNGETECNLCTIK